MPKEVITLNVGGAGLNIGQAVCQQYMAEHGLGKDGVLSGDTEIDSRFTAFFQETAKGRYVSRSLSADLDPMAIDALKTGPMANLYDPDYIVSGHQGTGCNYAQGYMTVGAMVRDAIENKIRRLLDNAEGVGSFVINRSLGGGTGSGLGSIILEEVGHNYRKKFRMGVEVLSGDVGGRRRPLETYNQMFGTHHSLDYTNFSLVFDNSKLGKICKKQLDVRPNYQHVNALIAKICSGVTSSVRLDASVNSDLGELEQTMVSFPRLHFMTSSFIGFKDGPSKVKAVAEAAFQPQNMSLSIPDFDAVEDKYMGITMEFRGYNTPARELDIVADWLKQSNKITFTDACPGFLGTNTTPEPISDVEGDCIKASTKSAVMVGNNVGISRVFAQNNKRFDMMYSQRAYVFQYVDNALEEGLFSDAREDMGFLEKDYLDCATEEAEDEDEDFR